MASLESVLASIPGIAGYTAKTRYNQQADVADLQKVGALMALQQKIQEAQRGAALRNEIASLSPEQRTPENLAGIGLKHVGGAKDVLGHADTMAKLAATREIAASRLAQTYMAQLEKVRQFEKVEDRQAAKDRLDAWYKDGILKIRNAQAAYDLPPELAPKLAPQPTATPPPATGNVTMIGSTPSADLSLRGVPAGQIERLAMADPTFRKAVAEAGGGQAQPPTPATTPVPTPSTPAPVPSAPMPDAANLDARDLMARGAPVPQPAVASPAPSGEPEMPAYIKTAPRRIQDQWKLAQSKPGAGGSASDAVVQAIAQGRMQIPTGFALRSPYWQDVIERVAKLNPQFDATRYTMRNAAARTFGSGPEARNVTAMNTLIGHLGTLDEMAGALENKDVMTINRVVNRMRTELGDPRVQNFETARNAVADETARVFRSVGMSDTEIEGWKQRMNSAGSPAQLRGVIATIGELLDSRINAMAEQYRRTTDQTGNPAAIDPKNRVVLDRFREGGSASAWTADKERRYQELLKKRGSN